jgi:hypothetical protein
MIRTGKKRGLGMWRLANHKRRLLALSIAAATMLVLGILSLRGDIVHGDGLEQDPEIYLPLVMKRYCSEGWQDDFSDPSSGWPAEEYNHRLRLEYLDGEFHVLINKLGGGAYFWTDPPVYATNFTLEVDGRSDLGGYGLIFGGRYETSDGYEGEGYSFDIRPASGWWLIYKWWLPEGNSQMLDSGSSPYITSGMNRLKIVRQGSQIEVYVNGHLLSTLTDSSFLGSRIVGLDAWVMDTVPIHAYFDNFWVCPVDSTPGAGTPGMGEAIILQKGTPPTIEFWPR